MKVRQHTKDAGRMTYSDLTVVARMAGGGIIECRDATGNTHKIDSRCLELAQNGTTTNSQRVSLCV